MTNQPPPRREIDGWFRQQYEYLQEQIVGINRELAGQVAENARRCGDCRETIHKKIEVLGENLRGEMSAFKDSVRSKAWLVYMALVAALFAAFFTVMREARGGFYGYEAVGADTAFHAP